MIQQARPLLLSLVVLIALAVLVLIQSLFVESPPSESVGGRTEANHASVFAATEFSALDPPSVTEPPTELARPKKVQSSAQRKPGRMGLKGTVRAPDGSPIAAAILSWTPLLPEHDFGPALRNSEQRYAEIKGASLLAQTDRDGKFEFPAGPEQASEFGSVVWLMHPDWTAEPVLLPKRPVGWHWPQQLNLQPANGLGVTVINSQDQPVPGANVRLRLSKRQAGQDDQDPLARAREFLWFEGQTSAKGTVRMPVGPGKQVLQAFQGELLSNQWVGEPEDDIELELLRSFTIEGVVRITGSTPLGEAIAVHQRGWDRPQKPGEDAQKNSAYFGGFTYVGKDGSFGPRAIPLVERDMLTLVVTGFEIVPEFHEMDFPGAGERIQVDFEVTAAQSANVLVTDTSGDPLEGATVLAILYDGSGTSQSYRAKQPTDGEGRARVGSLPKGNVSFEATLDGFLPGLIGYDLPPAPQLYIPQTEQSDPFVIALEPARRIRGQVMKAGEPVDSFRITTAEAGSSPRNHPFKNKHGKFELMVAQGVELSLLATALATPQSETQAIAAGTEDVEDVEFDLQVGVPCKGSLRDITTGAVIAEAEISVWTTLGPDISTYRGDVYSPDAEGHFEIPGMLPGRGALEILAPGYTPQYVLIPDKTDSEGHIEMTNMQLVPTATANVSVVGYAGDGFEDFRIWGSISPYWDPSPLEADGTKLLEGVPANRFEFFLRLPDGTTLSQSYTLEAHTVQEVVFDLGAGSCAVDVSLDRGAGETLPEPLTVELSLVNGPGETKSRSAVVPADGLLTFENLPAGEAAVVVTDANNIPRGLAVVNLSPASRAGVSFDLDGALNRIRILDHQGQPVKETRVTVTLPGNRGGWLGTLRTDSLGEFSLGAIEGGQVVLTFSSTVRSLVMGKRVELAANQTTVVVLDEPVALSLFVNEGGEPRPHTAVFYTCDEYPVRLWSRHWNVGEGGRGRGYLLQPGEMILEIKDSPYWPMRVPVNVTPGMARYALEVYSPGNLEIRVRTKEGLPAGLVQLALEHEQFGSDLGAWIRSDRVRASDSSLRTDSNGRLTLEGVPRGQYAWTASFPDGSVRRGNAVLAPRATLEIRIE